MSIDVLMPQLGETTAEGKITAWFKAEGDQVNEGDDLFEVETDKASMTCRRSPAACWARSASRSATW